MGCTASHAGASARVSVSVICGQPSAHEVEARRPSACREPSHRFAFLTSKEGTRTMAEKSNRGFAGMDKERQRQIASKGGKAAHAKGTAHQFTPEEARAAGRKGGQAAHQKGTAHEFTPEEAREAGRKGGLRSHARNTNGNANGAQEGQAPAQGQQPLEHNAQPLNGAWAGE